MPISKKIVTVFPRECLHCMESFTKQMVFQFSSIVKTISKRKEKKQIFFREINRDGAAVTSWVVRRRSTEYSNPQAVWFIQEILSQFSKRKRCVFVVYVWLYQTSEQLTWILFWLLLFRNHTASVEVSLIFVHISHRLFPHHCVENLKFTITKIIFRQIHLE